jgi:hypothetical protein
MNTVSSGEDFAERAAMLAADTQSLALPTQKGAVPGKKRGATDEAMRSSDDVEPEPLLPATEPYSGYKTDVGALVQKFRRLRISDNA